MKSDSKFDFNYVTGQYHYQNGGKKEDLQHPNAIDGYESAERFRHKIQKEIHLKNERKP